MSGDLDGYRINQQDNQIFRQVRTITCDASKFNKYVVFVSCKGASSHPEEFDRLVLEGFRVNGEQFVISERSASMTRQGILSFVSEKIHDRLTEAVCMGLDIKNTVLSKYMAYRGLMFSSCHCIEDWVPYIVIIPDRMGIVKQQSIKYCTDETTEYLDKYTGEKKTWTQKVIKDDVRDIEINMFDGCGVHHPDISWQVKYLIGAKELPTSIQWRMPFIKGVTHSVDYETFFSERGVEFITDIWGIKHSVHEKMVIMTEGMYKGLKYFKQYGTFSDWELYWERFRRYNHCVGIAKWNFTKEQEPVYTRANYQILQDLELDYDTFSTIANKSIEWVQKIVDEDVFYTYCYLGMFYDLHKPMNDYVKAIVKNPAMMGEKTIREYIINLLSKYIDEFKCGKLWVKGTFKILCPDLCALLEHAGGLEVNGCLEHDEFYATRKNGEYVGEFLLERNPHICKSEHTILRGVKNDITEKYFKNLDNVCMVNIKSITPQRLNGADYDGDLTLLIDDKTIMSGVDRSCPVVIDVEDKITALSEDVVPENVLKLIKRTLHSMIGETSNCATAYHNKIAGTEEQRKKYQNYVNLLSIINGKSISKFTNKLIRGFIQECVSNNTVNRKIPGVHIGGLTGKPVKW